MRQATELVRKHFYLFQLACFELASIIVIEYRANEYLGHFLCVAGNISFVCTKGMTCVDTSLIFSHVCMEGAVKWNPKTLKSKQSSTSNHKNVKSLITRFNQTQETTHKSCFYIHRIGIFGTALAHDDEMLFCPQDLFCLVPTSEGTALRQNHHRA